MKQLETFYRLLMLMLLLIPVSTSKAVLWAAQNGWYTGAGIIYAHLDSEFPTLPPQDTISMQIFTGFR